MRKLFLSTVAVVLATIALVAAGCGSAGTGAASTATIADGMTVAQIMARSQQAMGKVSSASFTADATFKVSSNGSSATGLMLGGQPIALHLAGKVAGHAGKVGTSTAARAAAAKAARADIAVTIKTGAQAVDLGFKTTGGRTWVGFQGAWYAVPRSKRSAGANATPVPSATSLGIDPGTWAASSTVATEQLDGAKVYHVVAKADTARVMSDFIKALTGPAASRAAGSAGGAGAELNLLTHDSALLKSLQKSLASASVEEWIDATSFRLVKGAVTARLHFGSGQSATGLGVQATVTLSGFDQPVTVVPPLHAKPFKQLTNGLSSLGAASGAGL